MEKLFDKQKKMLDLDTKRILKRKKRNESIFTIGSGAWMLEDPSRLLHPYLKSLEDAEKHTRQKGQGSVPGVYLREEPNGEIYISNVDPKIQKAVDEAIAKAGLVKKIGKGTVENGELTRETGGSSRSEHLKDLCFIPCRNELAAYMLEYILQILFGRPKRTQALEDPALKEAIDKKFKPKFKYWKPTKQGRYKSQRTGTEYFNPILTLSLFKEELNNLVINYKDAGQNKQNFNTKKRKYQDEGSEHFVDCAIQIGNFELALKDIDFYLLMKPRSGKNLTMLLALAKYHKKGQILGWWSARKVIDILFTSLVPAAFDGTYDDIDKHWFDKDVKIDYVDTSKPNWQSERLKKIKQGANVIILFSSMQSIDEDINKEITNDWKTQERLDITQEEFNKQKLNDLLKLNIQIMVLDESDFGLRTPLAQTVIKTFGPKIKMHLSGSDLYAIRTLIKDSPKPNYFKRDVIDEDKDIDAGLVDLPKLRFYYLKAGLLPFDDMNLEEMDERGISRCLRNMYLTNVDRALENAKSVEEIKKIRKYNRDPHTNLWVDGLGREIQFENVQEFLKFKRVIENLQMAGFRLLEHQHIFNTVPTQVGQLAFENFCMKNDWFGFAVKTGYEFSNAGKRQREVKDWMGISEHNPKGLQKTWFVTVAKMLRGATVPWSAVVRCDEFTDFKIGHQIDLRAQNAYGPDEKHCDIFDMNPWRRKRSHVELMKMSSHKGDKFKLLESTSNRLMPWCIGAKDVRQSTLEETEDAYNNFRSLTDGFHSANLYNVDSVLDDIELLKKIGTASKDDEKQDPRAGKKSKKKNKKIKNNKNVNNTDQTVQALKLIKNFANYIPLLQFVTQKNKNNNNKPYHTIKDVLELSPMNIRNKWFKYVGLHKSIETTQILTWFNQDKFNEKLRLVANKIDRGLDVEEISQISKPKSGDVPVPLSLAKLIVDHIPVDFWHKPGLKIIDPCCGKGDFLKVIQQKLLSIGKSKKEISEILFYADPEEFNVITTNEILDLNNGFSYNILQKPRNPGKDATTKQKNTYKQAIKNWKGELAELELKTKNMKFDLFITNPPYQSTDDDGNRNDQAKNLWTKFIKLGNDKTKDNGFFSLVTPTGWTNTETADIGKGEKGIHFYKDIFQKYKTYAININDCKKYFNEGSSFSYFVVQKTISDNFITEVKSEIDNFNIDLRNVKILPKKVSRDNIDILEKLFYNQMPKINFIGNNLPETRDLQENTKDIASEDYCHKNYSTPAKGGKYVYSKIKMKHHDSIKVTLSISGEYKPIYDEGKLGYDGFCILYILKENETIENIKSFLNHPVVHFGMDQTRLTGFLSPMADKLPDIGFNKKWKHQEVYDVLGITNEQRILIDDWFNSRSN